MIIVIVGNIVGINNVVISIVVANIIAVVVVDINKKSSSTTTAGLSSEPQPSQAKGITCSSIIMNVVDD